MEGVGSEVSLKIRSAIKAKLVELGTYVDEELPDYIMVLVANKKTKDQMDDDLSLFLGHNTERFTSWLHHVLQKLNAAALLQVTTTQQEEPKKKDAEEDKRRDREEEKKRERDEEKKREKAEEMKKMRDEEKRKAKEKEKADRKRKSSERKVERKDKKLRKPDSPVSQDKSSKEKKVIVAPVKLSKSKEPVKEKESREKIKISSVKQNAVSTEKTPLATAPETSVHTDKMSRKLKSQVRGKVSCADIFRAEAAGGGEQLIVDEEEDIEDMLVLRADIDELGLELEEEPAPKKSKIEQRQKISAPKAEGRVEPKAEVKIESRIEPKQKIKSKLEPVSTRVSAKERLGIVVLPKSDQPREKPSVLDRLGTAASSGRRVINLREESSFPPRPESSSSGTCINMARAVSSAISSAHRSVCVLPSSSSSSGKKLEARVRPLMSKQVESSHDGSSRESSTRSVAQGREEPIRESSSRSVSGRVVSAVGAVLKRSHSQVDSDEEEYDPKKPQLSGMASKVEVIPRPRRPGAIQANTALILRAMADAHKSVNKPSRRTVDKSELLPKKQKGELFTRGYREREREQARHKDLPSQEEGPREDEIRIRKIAITVPNATRKESEKQLEEEKMEEVVLTSPEITTTTEIIEKDEMLENVIPMEEEHGPVVPDSGFGMEEVEEVEEEVVDEGIEEDQPLLPPPPQPRIQPLAGVENTKFIVTLEGVDTGVFAVKDEHLDIRSRLGGRPVHNDSLEVVEEYIEEVEELEEEEETLAETLPAVGHIAGGTKERCKFWPLCKAGESCPYHHPTVTCKSFPSCKFGDKCLYIHPNCLFDGACTRIGCPYTHASSRNLALASAAVTQKHKIVPQIRPTKVKCKFFPKCTNMSCSFFHPKACFYGISCTQANCPYTHPTVPMGAKLKWIAPKTSVPPGSTPAASEDKAKEIERQDKNLVKN
ncbi:zinc finger CCCH domain-containing protein 14 isoform X2 [Procambarus clarkii]|uniref:zinc finger CCCH domain-containing protein 14 isoform X2 n=1 Tax=Procambarus clarkii TaxID=6728 RepID=UPI001E675375|nr:zinc finger CCCH domain-containing protein 14-like isoform X2 [Procambarus clarkii]